MNTKMPLVITALSLLACGRSPESSSVKRYEVPQNGADFVELGQAFDTDRVRMLNIKCVEGDMQTATTNAKGSFDLGYDLSFEEMLKKINGKLSVDVNFPAVRAGVGADYAKDQASSSVANAFTFTWDVVGKKDVLKTGSYRPTAKALEYARNPSNILQQKCGNEFVKEIEYGAHLFVNMKVDYLSKADKEAIGGKLKLAIGEGGIDIVKLEGDLSTVNSARKESVSIKVSAQQIGGNPLLLTSIIPNNAIECNLKNPEPCFNVFNEAISYAKNSITQQMATPNALVPVKYITERYDESGVEELVPTGGYEVLSQLTKERIRLIDRKVSEAMLDYSRASSLLGSYAGYLGKEQTAKIQAIYDAAFGNSVILGDTSKACYDNPGGCIAYSDSRLKELKTYDRNALSLDELTNLNRVGFGSWSFGYQLPATAFTVTQTGSGFFAEDYDGFTAFSPAGEAVRLAGSFRNRPCSEVESLLQAKTQEIEISSTLDHAVSVTQTRKGDRFSLRVLAAYRTAGGECASFTFHSQDSYRSNIDFTAVSSLKRGIVDVLSSVAR
jgi:hypothetical protein